MRHFQVFFVVFVISFLKFHLNAVPLDGVSQPENQNFLTSVDFENGRKLLADRKFTESEFDYSQEVVLRQNGQRNAHRYRRWPNGVIPFEISSLYNQNERNVIAGAIQEYHTKTCVRFVNHGSEIDFIHITPDDGLGDTISPYCYSYVGKIGRKQFVKMYRECVRLAAMIHELGHVIGFEHEHNRVDRDNYIDVQWQNIDPVYYYAFNKVTEAEYDTLGLPYDYYSTMHYPDYSFANPGLKSFRLKFPGDISYENQRLSPTDVLKINKYYGCA